MGGQGGTEEQDFMNVDMIMAGIAYGGKGIRMSDILVAGTEYVVPVATTDDDAEAANAGGLTTSAKSLVNKYLQILLQSNVLLPSSSFPRS